MKTKTLVRALKRNIHTKEVFGGVLPCNWLPKRVNKNKNVAFIVNTDPSDKKGQHWVAFFFTPCHSYFFDAYGNAPKLKVFEKFLRKRKESSYFNTRVQGTGRSCGYFCLFFILSMLGKVDWNVFGDYLQFNDQYVIRIMKEHFHLK